MPVHVVVALVSDMSATSVAVTLQALDAANRLAESALGIQPPFKMTVGSVQGGSIVCGPGGFSVPTVRLAGLRPGLIIVPGAGAATKTAVERLLAQPDVVELCRWLNRHAERTIAASCSGVFVLAAGGLLEDHAATTTWWLAPYLASEFPSVTVQQDAMVVEDRKRCTAGASLAQLDLMLHLIAREVGPGLAELVARYLVVEERPSQARYVVPSYLARASTEVTAAERWVRRHVGKPFGVPELARGVGLSPRTLSRRIVAATGDGPHAFVRRIRIDVARHLLATTKLSVDQVAAKVGYEDPASLRRAFAKMGEKPSDSRRRISA